MPKLVSASRLLSPLITVKELYFWNLWLEQTCMTPEYQELIDAGAMIRFYLAHRKLKC